MQNNKILIFSMSICLVCIVVLGIFITLLKLKIFKSKKDILIDAFTKDYLIPRTMNMRNFAVLYLLEYGKLNLQRMDPFYEFYTYAQNKDFHSQCKKIFKRLEPTTIDLMHQEFLNHLSEILTYRCYYHPNPETKKLVEKEKLFLHVMDFNQESDKQMIKQMFSIEYQDSGLFQIAMDWKLKKANKRTLLSLIEYL